MNIEETKKENYLDLKDFTIYTLVFIGIFVFISLVLVTAMFIVIAYIKFIFGLIS